MILKIKLMIMMTMASLSLFAQYPTTKKIKGQEVVIMTVPQAQAIDNKFETLKDSINQLKFSLNQKSENLKTTSETLSKTNDDLIKIQDSLNQSSILNMQYLIEIEKYKKMEFQDRKVNQKVTIGFTVASLAWIFYVISSLIQ